MFRPASRSLLHQSLPTLRRAPYRCFLSTVPPAQKSRTWKSSATRWGLAAAAIYYYNTSTVFTEEPEFCPPHALADPEPLPTLSSLSPLSRKVVDISPQLSSPPLPLPATLDPTATPPSNPLSETEEEASQQGAFNEETGEINWDCPCLGGMAHGPCGEEFRSAFSCFVYSKEEPKGMDCIDRFKGMQDCFREHPDVYGEELEGSEDEDGMEGEDGGIGELQQEEEDAEVGVGVGIAREQARREMTRQEAKQVPDPETLRPTAKEEKKDPPAPMERAKAATAQVSRDHEAKSESDDLVPKVWHDSSSTNEGN